MKAGAAVLLSIVVIVVVAIGGYKLHWWLSNDTADQQYHVNTHTQQYQAGLIGQARDDARGWGAATDPGQKSLLAGEFCAAYADLTQVPDDIAQAAGLIGC